MLTTMLEELYQEEWKVLVGQLRKECGWISSSASDEEVYMMYVSCVSKFQTRQRSNGNHVEDVLSRYLSKHGIQHQRQVYINREGMITTKEDSICLVDFVIGDNILIGTHVSGYTIVSVKKSCRERWLQDEWTFAHPPKKYILFTLSDDYPDPLYKFCENEQRKIITHKPKRRDRRRFKLFPNDLCQEIKN